MLPTLAVTGATGAVGGAVARDLAAAGVPQRLLVRDPSRAPALPGAVPLRCAYADADAADVALAGVETLLMVSAAESADRLGEHLTLVAAAARAGVRHVVYTSFLGASPTCTFTLGRDHHATEEAWREAAATTGLTWTFLRDSFYADFFADLPGEDGVIRGPAGEGRVAPVARADVARCAAAVLRAPGAHAGATYDLTGPEALTLREVASVVGEVTGREVRYHDETVEEAHCSRAPYGAPDWQVAAWVSTYTAIAAGELDVVGDGVERLTGRAPLTLREVLEAPR